MMKLKIWKYLLIITAFVRLTACREAYDPSIESGVASYLVVEGFINVKGVTSILLTRTQRLAEKGITKYEMNASVQIEGDNNNSFPLTGSGNGMYRSEALNLPADRQYRLRIKTSAGREYLSDYVAVKQTPEQAITWQKDPDGLRLYVNSSDPANQTRYYKWAYEETWELRSIALSQYVATQLNPNVRISERTAQDQINALICWKESLSNSILINSTAALSEDVVDRFPVLFIPNGSEKLAFRYSILLKQYALTREAYEFFELMKKNSEQLGTVFDPQPSTARGNIHGVTDPSEYVIGYMIAASSSEKRIFISKEEAGWEYPRDCWDYFVVNHPDSLNKYFRDGGKLISTAEWGKLSINGYHTAPPECLDCRKRGGNNNKPGFW